MPGKPEESELVRRILSADADERMPPADSGKRLSEAQKQTLRQWIAEGAEYKVALGICAAGAAIVARWSSKRIGRRIRSTTFVLARLECRRLKPSPEADQRDSLPPAVS